MDSAQVYVQSVPDSILTNWINDINFLTLVKHKQYLAQPEHNERNIYSKYNNKPNKNNNHAIKKNYIDKLIKGDIDYAEKGAIQTERNGHKFNKLLNT